MIADFAIKLAAILGLSVVVASYWDRYVLTASRGRSKRQRRLEDALGLSLIVMLLAVILYRSEERR